jgi:hypothetical protein
MLFHESTVGRGFQGVVAALILATPSLAAAAGDEPDFRPDPRKEQRFRPVALTVNPLSWILYRFGANVEVLPAPHHGLMASASYQSADTNTLAAITSHHASAEAGYRYYFGSHGADGIFLAPTLVGTKETLLTGLDPSWSPSVTSLGFALDVGGQYVDKSGFTIGAGGGLMYAASFAPVASEVKNNLITPVNRVSPRLALTVGWSF